MVVEATGLGRLSIRRGLSTTSCVEAVPEAGDLARRSQQDSPSLVHD